MKLTSSYAVLVLAAVPLLLGACGGDRPEDPDFVIPPGVSVDPPRSASQTGGLTLPGTEPDTTLQGTGPAAGTVQPDTLVVDTPALPNRP
ncbi:hypothetical protein BH23GEM3_BH23GEM3_12520 [soil metagenome]|nr:hypothetical protein [Gemmatimonadota bacterium]